MKLNPNLNRQIVSLYLDRHLTQAAIAKLFGVSQPAISAVLATTRRSQPSLPKRCRPSKDRDFRRGPTVFAASQMRVNLDWL